jgi:hypothetical protein
MIPDTTIENQDYYLRSVAGAGAVEYRNNTNRHSRPSHRNHHNFNNNSKQVYSNLIEAKNNSLILTATSKLNNKMKNKTKKSAINITSSYAIENDNFIMAGNNEIFSNNLHHRHHNQKEESDEYYDYLELKQQLFNSSIKTQQQQQIEDLSPARQRLNNLNKNLHTMIKNKRLKSAGAKSTSSVEAVLLSSSSTTKQTTPATFYNDNPQLQLLNNTSPRPPSLKQPQILNMKFKSANANDPPSSANNGIKSKPSSASTHHSSNRFVFFSNY